MTNEQLLFQVAAGLMEADRITKAGWEEQRLGYPDARQLVQEIGKALAGALELQRRAAEIPRMKEESHI